MRIPPHTNLAPPPSRRCAGFSLVEAVLCCLLVGVAMVPALAMLGTTKVERQGQEDLIRGVALAKQLLSEIVQCHYTDPDGETGESRTTWDDVSDYNGLSEASPTAKDGTAIAGFTGWSRSVVVVLADPNNPDNVSATDVGLKKITVTVRSPAGKTYSLSALRSNVSIYERPVSAASDYTAGVTLILKGSDGSAAATGVNLPNQVP